MKMSLMSKLLTSTIALTAVLNAGMSDEDLLKYFKKIILSKSQVKLNGVEVVDKQAVPGMDGWEVYLTNMKLNHQGKDIAIPQVVFINGDVATPVLYDAKNGQDLSDDFKPKVPESMYDDAHRVFGNKDAKHKILVFSDPQCPFCMEVVPDIMKAAMDKPDKFALYYYHLPLLSIHPVSDALTRIMHVAQKQGKNDVIYKLYSLKINPDETNEDKILATVKTHSGFVTTKEEINKQEVKDALKLDLDASARMMITGTPTVYVDGVWDKNRDKYKSL